MYGDSALGMRTKRPGLVHDKDVRATKEFYHDRDFSIATNLDSGEKEKRTLGTWGFTNTIANISFSVVE